MWQTLLVTLRESVQTMSRLASVSKSNKKSRRRGHCGRKMERLERRELMAGNLLQNGSFELDPVTGGGWDTFDYLTGWNVVDNTGKPELQKTGLMGWRAGTGNGSQWLELDGDENGPSTKWNADESDYRQPISGRAETGLYGITQTVETVPGTIYLVSFDIAARPGLKQAENRMQVTVSDDQGQVASRTEQAKTTSPGKLHWEGRSFTFTARSTSTTLTLRGLGPDNTLGLLLDDVRLTGTGNPPAMTILPPNHSRGPLPAAVPASPLSTETALIAREPRREIIASADVNAIRATNPLSANLLESNWRA